MKLCWSILFFCGIFLNAEYISGQDSLAQKKFYGFLFNREYVPIPNTVIINLKSGHVGLSDKLGYFEITAIEGDYIRMKNLAYMDTIIRINSYKSGMLIVMSEKLHPIGEVKIFPWGNSYEDFTKAFFNLPKQVPVGVKIGVTHENFDTTPFYLKDEIIKNPLAMRKSPISFLYYNLSRREKIIRKAHKYKQDTDKREFFNAILSRGNIAKITKLEGEMLDDFMIYLNSHLVCNHDCMELELISEIYYWWEVWGSE